MLSSNLQILTQESHSSPTFLIKPSHPNLIISYSSSSLLLYSCTKYLDLLSQYPSCCKSVFGISDGMDLKVVVLTGEVIQIISIVRSKVLYEIIVGSDAFGIVSLKEDLIGVISEFSLDIWNLKTKEKRKTLTVERVVAYVSQDSRLYIGSCDGKVWISNGDDIEFLFQVNQEIINLEVFDDYIAIVTKEGDLELRRISTKTCLASISIAGSISVGMWASSSTGLLQIGVGLDNGDVHVFSTLLKDDQEQILSKELTFQEPHVISHKKSTKPIRSICFVNGSLVFSGDAAIVWKYSLDLLG